MSLPALINYFAEIVLIRKLLLEKLRDLRDTMPRQSSLCFLLFCYHHVTYRTTCHTSGHLVIYRECYGFERAFFTLRCFLPCTPSCYFQDLSGAGSLTLRLAGLLIFETYPRPSYLFQSQQSRKWVILVGLFKPYGWLIT